MTGKCKWVSFNAQYKKKKKQQKFSLKKNPIHKNRDSVSIHNPQHTIHNTQNFRTERDSLGLIAAWQKMGFFQKKISEISGGAEISGDGIKNPYNNENVSAKLLN